MNMRGLLWAGVVGVAVAGPMMAQSGDEVIGAMYRPAGPLASYEVASIRKGDVDARGAPLRTEGGWVSVNGGTMMSYIKAAYEILGPSQVQVLGAPGWVGSERYVVQGKASDELHAALMQMSEDARRAEICQMMQSLLRERFQLKVHFERREMAVYDLGPAKSGLKMKEVAPPPGLEPGTLPPPPPPPPPSGSGPPKLIPGLIMMRREGAISTAGALALDMKQLIDLLRSTPEIDGRPIADKTGFKGNFDVVDLRWAGIGAGSDVDAPGLFTALEEQLGLKLKPTKGLVEVLVIDSIERPTEN